QCAHAVLHRLAARIFSGDLRGVRRRLARALEAHRAAARPGDGVALRVGDGDVRVVERRVHVRDAGHDVLALALLYAGCVFGHWVRSLFLGGELLAGDRLRRAFARAGVGVRALAADRQALAVTQTTVAAEVHETLDVSRGF